MSKPIPGKAEVAVEYSDKLYIGTFEHTARFEAHADETGVALSLQHGGAGDERKSVHLHFHYALFAEILRDIAATVPTSPPVNAAHRETLRDAAEALYRTLGDGDEKKSKNELADLTPQDEVLLLHVLE
jgi:hypothetical protein